MCELLYRGVLLLIEVRKQCGTCHRQDPRDGNGQAAHSALHLPQFQRLGRAHRMGPIPQNKWQYLRSVQIMASLCPMVSCSTLSALANACKKLAG